MSARELNEVTLFSFDSYAFPFQTGVRLKLHSFPSHLDSRPQVVVPVGKPGSADSGNISYYGTVRKVGSEYWMWYLANDDSGEWHQRLCIAKSKDGKNWEKPSLGAYMHNGNKNNNVCDFPINAHVQACVVFYDPDEKDKNKTFKLSFESPKYNKYMGVAFSPDGVHWTEYEKNPVGKVFFEQAGGLKRDGVYYVNGQGSTGHYSPKGARALVTYCSRDFINWTPAACLGFTRESIPPKPTYYGGVNGPQVHLGAGLWDRGNVIVGFYGMWEGHPSNDRNLVYMHLGMVVSHDGLHFYEPVPDFPIVLSGEMKNDSRSHGHYPALMQGQGCENIGDETVFWFGLWPESDSDGVRIATWGKDRIGHLEPFVHPGQDCFIITDEIHTSGKPTRVSLNVSGICEYSKISVSVLDEDYNALPGYSAVECSELTEGGFKLPVIWQNKITVNSGRPIRLKIDFGGIRPEDIKLYAIYLEN
jgi:hypothetical protein